MVAVRYFEPASTQIRRGAASKGTCETSWITRGPDRARPET
jgi:hypothetical protein